MSKYSLSNLEFTIKETLKEIKKHNIYANELENENILLKVEIERLKDILDVIHEEIKYLYRKPKRMWYDDIQTLKTINEIVEKELKGVDKE